jgi:queuine tRNA-ribosyltransferase
MESMPFKINHEDGNSRARAGVVETKHGIIETPAFVPVGTQATVKSVTPAQLLDVGSRILMMNTYHLYLRPGAELIENFGGLHKFMGWERPIMTDSGGFQIFSLNDFVKISDDKIIFRSHIDNSTHEFTPEKSIAIQEKLGADLIFAFDECLSLDASLGETEKSMKRTHAWAERCIAAQTRKDQALFGIVQGGRDKGLRKESARFISSLGTPGLAVGSIFGEPKDETAQMLEWTFDELDSRRPVHLLGLGAVDDLFLGVEMGADMFDCVLPTRQARLGVVFSSDCTMSEKWRYRITNARFRFDVNALDSNCSCYTCKNFSCAYIHHLFRANELLANTLVSMHNLTFFHNIMKQMRLSIVADSFQELKKKWLK